MDYQQILFAIRNLPVIEQNKLINELTGQSVEQDYISSRREKLINKQVGCPHCNSFKYYRYGKDKGSNRFMCKECTRTFTEYSGTWLAGLHKKGLVYDYLYMMCEQKSLDKIKSTLQINKKTAFDWRHKILSSFQEVEKQDFNGIIESDKNFFLQLNNGRINRKDFKL